MKKSGFVAVIVATVVGVPVFVATSTSATTAAVEGRTVEFAAGVQNATPEDSLVIVSCASDGNCTAGGSFKNAAGGTEAFVVSSTNGTWGQATPIAFAAGVQNTTPNGAIRALDCSSAGNCTAGGFFKNAAGGTEAFVVSSTNGTWGQATPIAFAAGVQNTTPDDEVSAIDCTAAGECVAVGRFRNTVGSGTKQLFGARSTNGSWGQATVIPFVAPLFAEAGVSGLSCTTAGNCSVAGSAISTGGGREALVVSLSNGTWGTMSAITFAAGAMSSASTANGVGDIACASAGNCTVAGVYASTSVSGGPTRVYVVTQTNGTWGQAAPIAFAAGAENATPGGSGLTIFCVAADTCTAGGFFKNAAGHFAAYVVSSTNGTWGTASTIEFPAGIESATPSSRVSDLHCTSAGNCTAVGTFQNTAGGTESYVVSSTNGTWERAVPITFAAGLQSATPFARVFRIACPPTGRCIAVGQFRAAAMVNRGFITQLTGGGAGSATPTTTATTVAAPTTTKPTQSKPTTGSGSTVGDFDNAVPGVTKTDTRVYQTPPSRVAASSAITVLDAAQNKVLDLESRTPAICVPNDAELVFLDTGRCVSAVVNTKSRRVVRTVRTTVVDDDISKLRVGNAVAAAGPIYFDFVSSQLDSRALARIKAIAPRALAAGSVLVVGHSGTLNGNSPANVRLSQDRARSTVAALRRAGARGPFTAIGMGALDPASDEATETAQRRNRRAVIILIP